VCFEQALGVLQSLPEQHDTRVQAIDLRLALRSARMPSGDLGGILVLLREAETLALTLNDPRRLGQVCRFLASHFYFMGMHAHAIASAQRALALATAGGDVVLHALANQYLGIAYQAQGAYHQASACFRQTVASLDGEGRHERFGQVFLPAVVSRAWLASCQAELGRFTEGTALGDEGLQIAEAVDHPGSCMIASWGRGLLALRHGDLPRALPLLERAIGVCQDVVFQIYAPLMTPALGAAYAWSGRVADAILLLTQALEQATGRNLEGLQALCCLSLGEAQMLAGHLEEAHALTESALALAREHQERGNEAYALSLLGDIAARREPPEREQAEAHDQQALALAEELGMRPLQAHGHRGLGTLYATIGQREQARAALSMAVEMYQSMEMTFWLPETEAALAQVEGR
jgi:tetratricopeptide (TPR) repeat protein